MCHSRTSVIVPACRKSVKATLRDLGSLKVAFTDFGCDRDLKVAALTTPP